MASHLFAEATKARVSHYRGTRPGLRSNTGRTVSEVANLTKSSLLLLPENMAGPGTSQHGLASLEPNDLQDVKM